MDGENILIDDWLSPDKVTRYTMFSKQSLLTVLGNAAYWMADGTFSVVPTIYSQLFVIHCPCNVIKSIARPVVFVLMTGKSHDLYAAVLSSLKEELAVRLQIAIEMNYVIADFELAIGKAFLSVYTEIQFSMKGCNFHLAQSIFRKVKTEGLAGRYGQDVQFALQIRCFFALSFLPAGDFCVIYL